MSYLIKKDYEHGAKIYANYKLLFPFEQLTSAFFRNYKDFQISKATLGFDELAIYYSNRRSMSKHNQRLRPFILQTRKKALKLFYTAQQDRLVDVNIRENTDGYYFPKLIYIRDGKVRKVKEDYDYQKNDNLILTAEYFSREAEGYVLKKKLSFKHAERLFNLYDTYEILDFEVDGDD